MHYSEDESRQYHIQTAAGEVGRYVILPGDPKRCVKIARYLENPVLIADSREFVTYTGTLDGEKVSVTSTGIGGASASIAMEELIKCGADTFIRIGTCGGMQPQVKSGDIVIATGAVRMEGTSREYAPIEYPAVPDLDVTNALVGAAKELGLRRAGSMLSAAAESCLIKSAGPASPGAAEKPCVESTGTAADATPDETISESCPIKQVGPTSPGAVSASAEAEPGADSGPGKSACPAREAAQPGLTASFHTGVVQCKDSFYGQHSPEEMPVSYELLNKWEAWKRLGCLASEMESAAMFIVAASRGVRCGSCFLVMANQEREKLGLDNPVVHDTDLAVRVAIGGVRRLLRGE